MKTTAQKNSFLARHRRFANVIREALLLKQEYVATGADVAVTDDDFTGENEGLSTADMVNFQASVVNPICDILNGANILTVVEQYKST